MYEDRQLVRQLYLLNHGDGFHCSLGEIAFAYASLHLLIANPEKKNFLK